MSQKTRTILVADDEKPARERLKRLLAARPGVQVVGEAGDGKAALEAIAELAPDAVFLDIEMPELTGLEVAAALGAGGPAVIFCTAYDEYAVKAFEVNALDYVLKPVEEARLTAALARLEATLARGAVPDVAAILGRLEGRPRPSRFAIRCGARFVVLDLAEVSAVVAKDHYAEIVCGDRRILADDPLDAVEARLDPADYRRIHRGAIVNLRFLKELRREGDRKYVAVLADHFATELPVSREKLQSLKDALGLG